MTSPSKSMLLDKLIPLLEQYAAARLEQKTIRRALKSLGCTRKTRDEPAPCYHPTDGRSPWCDACREHDQRFNALLTVRKLNAKRLQRIERLAIRYTSTPEVEPVPPEPKILLAMMEDQTG